MSGSAIKKIGMLTSGGDGPGMNAAIRSVVRCALHYGLEVDGIIRGFQGLIDNEIIPMDHRSVANIINRGGTILKTARSEKFKTKEGQKIALENIKKHSLDALVIIGGDGSYEGAKVLFQDYGVATVALPGTIDNDIYGTEQTIGCNTAIHTALDAIDKIRDTAHSMERIFVIEVMGNKSGYIALEVALGAGAEDVIIPERKFDYRDLCARIEQGHKSGKISWMIIVAEGAARASDVAATVTKMTDFESRFVVLGHVQRGGTPMAPDRILATRLGAAAVELLLDGVAGKALGIRQDKVYPIDIGSACRLEHTHIDEYMRLLKILT